MYNKYMNYKHEKKMLCLVEFGTNHLKSYQK